ncbi:hypothetical protein BpHYR1_015770 [Brachionus plicatilis]|uniref:Uncharacterized protein n=1 Tax=Brachionus plicatilis TaxID=10195 RepID=A0A3M7Q9G0_BRAPC|nr:hypothetical protein BpHYR1_015770 [Brachionus plicatilis]
MFPVIVSKRKSNFASGSNIHTLTFGCDKFFLGVESRFFVVKTRHPTKNYTIKCNSINKTLYAIKNDLESETINLLY